MDEEVTVMVHLTLHVLLDCFINISHQEKMANTVGYLVSAIIAVFELMTPKHYQIFRNSLLEDKVGDIALDVSHAPLSWCVIDNEVLP